MASTKDLNVIILN